MQGDDASTAEPAAGRADRDQQGQARRANTTPNGGPHLELGIYAQKLSLNLTSPLLRRHAQHIHLCMYLLHASRGELQLLVLLHTRYNTAWYVTHDQVAGRGL